ncbi:Xylose isomerase-like TIM barrel [Planctomycetes bacterium Pan216]|uniref:Xylose isomerase-like TIM barrel n=1 Tax=Kolteria novifilia TaxID=2527975 RepID=A0A518BB38_9BACT|nr:Xylose isomerase-like TIM barrel [Planctomycetes bacterium Pan216]
MGYQQTSQHRPGKSSYHQIGLVRGQFGDIPEDQWLDYLAETGFDGWEEATWELDLSKCRDDAGAEAYAKERVEKAKSRGLEIFTLATHLQGQALGDEPSAKTLQFCGGEAIEAYASWRAAGSEPPRTDPYFVPEEVGKLIHSQAQADLIAAVRLAHYVGKLQDRKVPVPGFVGSPANCWSHFFEFPPRPSSIAGHAIAEVLDVSLELLAERFGPVFDACKKYGVTYDLECHPSERAMGDIESAGDYLRAMEKAGFAGVVGFNFDPSHMLWQNVSPIEFIREYGDVIHCAHIKGVQVVKDPVRAGLLGGHRPMGHRLNGWNFVTPGSGRDSINIEECLVELNRAGFSGAVSIEWEDNDAYKLDGGRAALANVHRSDLPPSTGRHDDTLKA